MMKGKLTLQQRLVMPILLLGLITLLSNLLAVFGINNVHPTTPLMRWELSCRVPIAS